MTRGCTGTLWASASPLWSSALQLKPPPACSSTASPSVRALPRAAHNPYNPNPFPLSFPQVPAPSPSPAPATTSRAAAQSSTRTPRSFTLQLRQWAAARALRLLLFFLLWRHSPLKNSLLFRWALRMLRAVCRRAMRLRLLLLLLLLLHSRVRIIPRPRPPRRLLRHWSALQMRPRWEHHKIATIFALELITLKPMRALIESCVRAPLKFMRAGAILREEGKEDLCERHSNR